jgi:hypothetical protein
MNEKLSKLRKMPLAERIAAVAADLKSKRDEYRTIDAHELASLLGIDDAYRPGAADHWRMVGFVPRLTVREILLQWNIEFIPDLLQSHVAAKRCDEIAEKIEMLHQKGKLERGSLNFLTKAEKRNIENLYMKKEMKSNGPTRVLAFYTVKAPHRQKLTFEALIEDDGACVDLKTPYDKRDGKFTDYSYCLIEEC